MAQVEDEPMLGHGTCLPDGSGPQAAEEAPVQLTEEEIKKSEEDFKVCYSTVLQHDAALLLSLQLCTLDSFALAMCTMCKYLLHESASMCTVYPD